MDSDALPLSSFLLGTPKYRGVSGQFRLWRNNIGHLPGPSPPPTAAQSHVQMGRGGRGGGERRVFRKSAPAIAMYLVALRKTHYFPTTVASKEAWSETRVRSLSIRRSGKKKTWMSQITPTQEWKKGRKQRTRTILSLVLGFSFPSSCSSSH